MKTVYQSSRKLTQIQLLTSTLILSCAHVSANTQFVDPFIGTGGDGHTFPGAVVPFGMVQLSPDTDSVLRGIDPQPDIYKRCAGYHYDDTTCDYECMATEYFYWAMTSLLGVQAGRCGEIDHEWELCTADDVRGTDTAITALLEGGAVPLPTVAPDGVYTP